MRPRVSISSSYFFLPSLCSFHSHSHMSRGPQRKGSTQCVLCPLHSIILLFLFAHYTQGMLTFFLNLHKLPVTFILCPRMISPPIFLWFMWWFESAWPMGSGTIRSCGLVGGSVSLCRWALKVPSAQDLPSTRESLHLGACRKESPSAAFRSRFRTLGSFTSAVPACTLTCFPA